MSWWNLSFFDSGPGATENPLHLALEEKLSKALDMESQIDLIFNYWLENRGRDAPYIKDLIHNIIKKEEAQKKYYVLGWSYFVLGWLMLDHDQLAQHEKKEEALDLLLKAQKKFARAGEKAAEIRAINGIASAHSQYGDFNKAIELYLVSLEMAEEIKDDNLISLIAGNVAGLLVSLKQYEEAIKYFLIAESVKIDSPDELAIHYSNFSKAYRYLGELDQAEEKALESVRLSKDGTNRVARAHSFLELGLIRQHQTRHKAAQKLFEKSLALACEQNIPRVRAISLLQLGIIELALGEAEKSLTLLQEALAIAREIKTKTLESEALLVIAEVYDLLGDYHNAYEVLKEGKKLEDQLFSEETVNKIGLMKVKQARKENLIYKDLYTRINTISQIGQAITSTLDLGEIGDMVYSHIKDLMPTNNLAIGLFEEGSWHIKYKIFIKDGLHLAEFNAPIEGANSLEAQCLVKRNSVIINDIQREKKTRKEGDIFSLINQGAHSLLCSPLIIRQKTLGLIMVQSTKKDSYLSHHLDILNALAAYIAIALENEKLFSYVNHLATTDYLTALPNRRSILEEASKEFARSKRYKKPMSVIIADIDKFKMVNDNYGHAAGDIALRNIASVFSSLVRETDMLGRIGGEEFLFVLPNTDLEEALILARRLCEATSCKKHLILGKEVRITSSFGVAKILGEDFDITEAIRRADGTLYEAKKEGGNVVKC